MKKMYDYINYIEVDKTPEELYKEFIKDFVNSIYKVGNNIANISTGYNNLEEKRINSYSLFIKEIFDTEGIKKFYE